MGLIKGELIAIDSFKIRAQNALKNNFNQIKVQRHIDYIDDKINEYQDAIDRADNDDEKLQIQHKITHQQTKKGKCQRIGDQLKATGESQVSLTDPDARSVVLHRNIVNVGYNIQAGCDGAHKLFINNDTGTVNDTQCTTAKNGRLVERSIYQEALENNADRVNHNPNYYRLRQQITEHQFGTLKRQWGFTYTLMKGKAHVLTEVNLMMMCYNLRRLMSIYGVKELKKRLKGLTLIFLSIQPPFKAILPVFIPRRYFTKSKNLTFGVA